MQSAFLNQIGLDFFDLGYLLIGVMVLTLLVLILIILLVIQISKANKLKKKLEKFLMGKNGESLEQSIVELFEHDKFLIGETEKHKKEIKNLYKKMESAYQKIGLMLLIKWEDS